MISYMISGVEGRSHGTEMKLEMGPKRGLQFQFGKTSRFSRRTERQGNRAILEVNM